MEDSRLGWLTFAWFDGFGARTLRKLWARFGGDGIRAARCPNEDLLAIGVTEQLVSRFLVWRNDIDPEMLARRLEVEEIRFILPGDEEFPSLLASSSDPPAALFVRGAPLHLICPVSIVGTRSMTPYGSRVTRDLAAALAGAGCEIVSGMALGIDAQAHEAAISVGGKTIAVLAGGCNDDAIYPRSNVPVSRNILEHGGTIVTEFPPGTESFRYLFPLRNRIIASLSLATIVVEAAESSGSLITAMLALEENRDVFAVPGPITSPKSAGANHLLSLGAIPCTGADIVLKKLGATPICDDAIPLPHQLPPNEKSLLLALSRPLHVDDLSRELHLPPSAVSPLLVSLMLNGLIEEENADIYVRTARAKRFVN